MTERLTTHERVERLKLAYSKLGAMEWRTKKDAKTLEEIENLIMSVAHDLSLDEGVTK